MFGPITTQFPRYLTSKNFHGIFIALLNAPSGGVVRCEGVLNKILPDSESCRIACTECLTQTKGL